MADEIEAKMKVEDFNAIRGKLISIGARPSGREFETNIYFDTQTALLKQQDEGLRLRIAKNVEGGVEQHIVTLKGPQRAGDLKNREEHETVVSDGHAAAAIFEHLGYNRQLSFEKRRESWVLMNCKVELDELPLLGTFVEIEGPSEKAVMEARHALGLNEAPLIKTSYIALLARRLEQDRVTSREIRF